MLIQNDSCLFKGGLYLRLSKDDEAAGESASISNQRKLLIRYAKEHNFTIKTQYIDDGYSGTNFVEVR